MTQSLFYIADTLNMRLDGTGNRFEGLTLAPFLVGPFREEIEVRAYSDVIGTSEASVFVSMGPLLWGYLVAHQVKTTLYIFDAWLAGIDNFLAPCYGGVSIIKTLTRLHKAGSVKAVFTYQVAAQTWKKLSPAQAEQELPKF